MTYRIHWYVNYLRQELKSAQRELCVQARRVTYLFDELEKQERALDFSTEEYQEHQMIWRSMEMDYERNPRPIPRQKALIPRTLKEFQEDSDLSNFI